MSAQFHFWFSGKQSELWKCLPKAFIDGVEKYYTECGTTKEDGATGPVGTGFTDWQYLGTGTILRSGKWLDDWKFPRRAFEQSAKEGGTP